MLESQDKEWRRLAEHYAGLWDDELLALEEDLDDLTEMARQALRDEIKKRGLNEPGAAQTQELSISHAGRDAGEHEAQIQFEPARYRNQSAAGEPPADEPQEFTWKVELCVCETTEQALHLAEMLRRARIDSWIEGGGRYSWDLNGPRIRVAADQLDQAQMVVAQPIPQDILNQSREEVPEFAAPNCPKCGAPDPLLTAVDPTNTWQCESCDHEWSDPTENPN